MYLIIFVILLSIDDLWFFKLISEFWTPTKIDIAIQNKAKVQVFVTTACCLNPQYTQFSNYINEQYLQLDFTFEFYCFEIVLVSNLII